MNAAITISLFVTRHFLLVCATLLLANVAWTFLYFILLAYASLTNSGMGGPLAWPAGLVLVSFVCLGVGWGIFTPACAVGRVFRDRFRRSTLYTIPIVFATGYFITLAIDQLILGQIRPGSSGPAKVFLFYLLFLSIPLVVYWWISEGSIVLLAASKKLISQVCSRKCPGEKNSDTPRAKFLG